MKKQSIFSGLRPENKGGSKNCPKRSFFGFKNVKNFDSGTQFFFSKIFHRTTAVKNTLCTKKHFFNGKMETIFKQKSENSQISEFLLRRDILFFLVLLNIVPKKSL